MADLSRDTRVQTAKLGGTYGDGLETCEQRITKLFSFDAEVDIHHHPLLLEIVSIGRVEQVDFGAKWIFDKAI